MRHILTCMVVFVALAAPGWAQEKPKPPAPVKVGVTGTVNADDVGAISGGTLSQAPQKPPEKPAVTEAAKPAPAPVLAEIDGLRLENAFLRLAQQQQVVDKLKTDLQALLASLQKPGYVIMQLPDGKLGYAPEPKK